MRLRNLRTPIAIVSLICGIAACGGSSSETPEPERPDSWQLKLRQASHQGDSSATAEGADANDITGLPIRNLDDSGPAKSTWGGKRRPVRAVETTTLQTSATTAEPAPAKKSATTALQTSATTAEPAPAKKSATTAAKKSRNNAATSAAPTPPATSAAPTKTIQN
jgi:hypothetical protein